MPEAEREIALVILNRMAALVCRDAERGNAPGVVDDFREIHGLFRRVIVVGQLSADCLHRDIVDAVRPENLLRDFPPRESGAALHLCVAGKGAL